MPRTLALFPDLHGIPRGKLSNRAVRGRESIGFSPGVFAKDIYGHPYLFDDLVIPVGAADMKVEIDGEEVRVLDGDPARFFLGADALVIGSAHGPDRLPHPFDIRKILQEFVQARLIDDTIQIGAELEFFLLGEENKLLAADGQAYAFGGLSSRQACIADILDALDGAGIDWLDLSQENERDQYEISLRHTAPLEQADRIFLARMIIRFVAARHRYRATFIAVNAPDMSPSNLHLHVSRESQNADALASAIQGTLHDGFAIYRPSHNSRYTKDIRSFASDKSDVAEASRFSAIRIIRGAEGEGDRVELRTPTADTNPYFTILLVLAGVMDPEVQERGPDRNFDFNSESSLKRFLASRTASHIFDKNGRELFGKLKLAEFRSALHFGGFENERAALIKVL